ncbi:ABC transporter permease (plasmid) [Paraburkholderia sp. PGU19]|uniref:ABC transporter permease n=1 Tax=Paraburkholderia sp. PGU19 TaxID=2735434 RepID=UPI0015DA4FF6|nr:ABC transporter permease [Paraburkholderia sp. PGU19]BCG03698.1 ABC transporter permease [Paraburkholderia sp. PGU19]
MKFAKPMFAPHTSIVERVWYFTLRGLAVLTLLYLILPVLTIVPLSFSSSTFLVYPIPGWSLRWYQNLIASDEWRMAAKNSFIVAPSATVLATVLGTLAAIGLTKANFKGKALLMAILISPMIVPVVVVGVGMYLFFAPLGLANTYIGLIMAHASLGVPFVVTTVAATLQGFNDNLVRASLSLGANPVKTFFSITLPVIAPGVISGALFAFATSFDEVVVTLFLAGADQTTLPRQMFTGIRENISPTIAALATILIVFSTCLLLALEWLRGRNAARAA